MNFNQQQQQLVGAIAPITAPTKKDVLQGRGQGVQRHPGNVKYRTLVFVNKVSVACILYVFVCFIVVFWYRVVELFMCSLLQLQYIL